MKRARHHKGSIYCLAWNPLGNLIATGSNDKTVKIMRFNAEDSINDVNGVSGGGEHVETELAMHDGTVRDLVFMGDSQTLVSGGAGDCKIYVTDCPSGQPVASLPGHGGHVLGLSTWASAGAVLASGSQVREGREEGKEGRSDCGRGVSRVICVHYLHSMLVHTTVPFCNIYIHCPKPISHNLNKFDIVPYALSYLNYKGCITVKQIS